MISRNQIANFVFAEPFRPFQITTSSGRVHRIRHPEMIAMGRSTVVITSYPLDEDYNPAERQVVVSLLLTESVELLDAAPSPQGS